MFFLIKWGKTLRFALVGFYFMVMAGCDNRETVTEDRPEIFCSIAPIGAYASTICGDLVDVKVVVSPGRSVHEFSPTPAEVRALQKARLYLVTGLPIERNLVAALMNTQVKVIDIAANITKLPISEAGSHASSSPTGKTGLAEDDMLDQHIWLSPALSIDIVEEITRALIAEFPEAEEQFLKRSTALKEELARIQTTLEQELAPYKGKSFLVYHPAFGYFAHDFDLHQVAVEHDGKAPTPRRLAELTDWVQREKIHILFSQEETNQELVDTVAKTLDCRVIELDVLSERPIDFFWNFGKALQEGNAL